MEMIQNIRNEFKFLLRENDWMDSHSNKAVQEKADAIFIKIGYPDYILDDAYLTEHYSRVNLIVLKGRNHNNNSKYIFF